jgi:hypothetical protein
MYIQHTQSWHRGVQRTEQCWNQLFARYVASDKQQEHILIMCSVSKFSELMLKLANSMWTFYCSVYQLSYTSDLLQILANPTLSSQFVNHLGTICSNIHSWNVYDNKHT